MCPIEHLTSTLFEPICERVLINFTQRYSLPRHAVTETQLHVLRARVDFSYSESDNRPDTTDL